VGKCSVLAKIGEIINSESMTKKSDQKFCWMKQVVLGKEFENCEKCEIFLKEGEI